MKHGCGLLPVTQEVNMTGTGEYNDSYQNKRQTGSKNRKLTIWVDKTRQDAVHQHLCIVFLFFSPFFALTFVSWCATPWVASIMACYRYGSGAHFRKEVWWKFEFANSEMKETGFSNSELGVTKTRHRLVTLACFSLFESCFSGNWVCEADLVKSMFRPQDLSVYSLIDLKTSHDFLIHSYSLDNALHFSFDTFCLN